MSATAAGGATKPNPPKLESHSHTAAAAIRGKSNATAGPSKNSAGPAPEKRHSMLRGIHLKLDPKTPADLVPALAMLTNLYEDGKKRIAALNAREKQSKQWFTDKEAAHSAQLKKIEAYFKDKRHTLSEAFHNNETREENRFFDYWRRVREREHRQFHTSLKIQHATMGKEKDMIEMYKKAISGDTNRDQVRRELAKVGGGLAPEIVFLQGVRRATARYCREALAEVRAAHAELGRGGEEPPSNILAAVH